MSIDKGRPITVPHDKKILFKELTKIPRYSWPTLGLAAISIGLVITLDLLALTGEISLIFACMCLSFTYYWFFSVIHDGVHRSICQNRFLNDFIGQIGTSIFAAYACLPLFRWAHMEHHRFTNDEGDPDIWCHGRWWTLPFRWMTIDFYYAWRLVNNRTPGGKKALRQSAPYIILGTALVALIILNGYWLEYLMLWFLPSRFAFAGIGFAFFWLPHVHWPSEKHDLRQSSNYSLATTTRIGMEWLLNPLLQFQNYHLTHHMWPTTPFYNNERVWKLLEPELNQRDLAIANNFKLTPELIYAVDHP